MAEFDVFITRQAHGTQSSNVLNYGRPLIVIKDIPGPDGIPLMNTPWTLKEGGEAIASGITDEEGHVKVLNALDPSKTYELEYPGRTVRIPRASLADAEGVKGLQQRLIGIGYDPGPVDGDFGPRTKSALIEFQLDFDLQVDGIYGPESKAKLLEEFGE